MTLTVKTPPATEPVSLSTVKDHLRIDTTDQDSALSNLIQAARERAERYLARALITQTLELRLDRFPSMIELPRPPIQSMDTITYIDPDGVEQTLASYDADTEGARIIPSHGSDWPTTRVTVNAVTVTYTAGYGDAADVPEAIKQGMLVQIERMYDRHDTDYDKTLAMVSASLMWPYREVKV